MSTSFLHNVYGVRGYEHKRARYRKGNVVFEVEQQKGFACVRCGSTHVKLRGKNPYRELKLPPIGSKKAAVGLRPQRVECMDCGGEPCQVKLSFADEKVTYTRAFERYVYELCQAATAAAVARHLGVNWHMIKEIERKGLRKAYAKPRLKDIRILAIDEVNVGKPYKYLTIVMDWDTGAVVHVGRGKGGDALLDFWKSLRASGAKVKAVAMDMSQAYTRAVQDNLPNAKIVYDPFHVVKLMNKKLTKLRRDLQQEAEKNQGKELKGIRWLLLKKPEDLNDDKKERQRLEEALRLNAPLATAYLLKEDLRGFWSYDTKAEARKFLKGWIARAEASGIPILKQFAKTLAAHRTGLLNYYDYRITNGPLEGTNNKIETLQKQAYGYRDFDYFALKIKSMHDLRYRLVPA